MTMDRREQVLRVLHAALAHDAAARDAFLTDACATDQDLRRDVEALLAQDPPAEFLGGVMNAVEPGSSITENTLLGRRIGVYQVHARLGAGGMGEVFRARDTKLGRDVALKMLPSAVGRDPARLARFEREARILATLNHPHIASIYGVEDSHGLPALVLELVEGETLAERLSRMKATGHAGVPTGEAVAFARQIASALHAAHDKGIVHRDLKPANIKFGTDGSVKVLDFGLAKAIADDGEYGLVSGDGTNTGTALGTVPYMSPEQARGEKVDTRTDIWAFGCVLYEMLTGHAPFSQATAADTVAAILRQEPDWSALPTEVTPAIRLLLERCFHKDVKSRLRDIGGVQLTLDAFGSRGFSDVIPANANIRSYRRVSSGVGLVLTLLLVGGLAVSLGVLREPDTQPKVTRLSIATRGAAALYIDGNHREVAITPDGSRVIYVGDGGRQIFVRALNELEPKSIATGSLLKNPFVSPDGQWIGYNDLPGPGPLWKVRITGGPPVRITSEGIGLLRGAVWLADNTIVFASGSRGTGLRRVSADGGAIQTLTTPDPARNEYDHYWPEALPDGRGILYTILARTGGLGAARIAVYDLETKRSADVFTGGSHATYLRSGHLVYMAGGTLLGVPFNADRRTVVGTPAPALGKVYTTGTGGGNFAISQTGVLVYAHDSGYDPFARTLSWIGRDGTIEPLDAPQQAYMQPRLSHDGTRVVYTTGATPENNPSILDIARGTSRRLRREAAREQQPSWSHDGRWIVFASDRNGGGLQIFRQAADGSGEPELLVERASGSYPSLTPDGTNLIFVDVPPGSTPDIVQIKIDGSSRVVPLVQGPFTENNPEISPDGRWLSYQSNSSGQSEIYVSPYPNVGAGRWIVSTAGGTESRWARNSRELFFMTPDGTLMGVRVKATGHTWAATTPVKVLDPGYWSSNALIGLGLDVSPDGKRFLVVTPPKDVAAPPELVVIQHWDQELEAVLARK